MTSPGKESLNLSKMLLTQTRFDVLGLEDTPINDQGSVYEEFKEQPIRDQAGMKQLFRGAEIIPHCLTIKVVVCGDWQV